MSRADRDDWDRRWLEGGLAPMIDDPPPPPAFAHVEHLFPTQGLALEVACGRGRGAMWIASRGMTVLGSDVSPVAIELAGQLAEQSGLSPRCSFIVHDLDRGLPESEPVDLLLCHLFRDPRLDTAMINRLAQGGLLAVVCLSEVGAGPGAYRVPSGELSRAFGGLEVLDEGEAGGVARILARNDVWQ